MADHPMLRLGSMELYDLDGDTFDCEVLVDGTSRGKAVPITEVIESFLNQGAIEVIQGYETREVPIMVTFTSGDILDGLADAEHALMAELGKPNELVWTPWHPDLPGDQLGTPIVFEVINSWLDPIEDDRWDLDETDPVVTSHYQIRLSCTAFVHAVDETTVAAAGGVAAPTVTSVSTASSATNWTGQFDGVSATPTLVSGTVQVLGVSSGGSRTEHQAALGLPASVFPVDVTTDRYIVVDFYMANTQTEMLDLRMVQNQPPYAEIDLVSVYATATAGQFRAVFDTDQFGAVSSLTNLAFIATIRRTGGPPGGNIGWRIDAVGKAPSIPNPGGERELLRTFAVNGSAPANGSLIVSHASSALGQVLLYTCPDSGNGYTPACRPFRVAGGVVSADGTAVSGSSEPLSDGPTFDYPAASLDDGEHLILIRAKTNAGTSTRTVFWSATPRLNGTDLDTPIIESTAVTMTTTYAFHRLGMIHLPTMTLPAGGFMRIGVDDQASGTTFDQLYVLNMTTGKLTQVDCGTGAAAIGSHSKYLFINAPAVENEGRGDILRGHSADRSDAFSAYPFAVEPGRHEFDPDQMVKVFTVATNPSTAVSVEFAYKAASLTRIKSTW